MDIEMLKNDLVANQKKFEEKVIKRNALNVEIVGIEFVINYIRELIIADEKEKAKILAVKKEEEKEKKIDKKEVKKIE